ncbi:sigma-54 interaction domain-containing protein [Desulfosporosinus youngiae]|uniref:PAS domain S-box n=1 Tax=Desulfosporosinus youngiae DSM 17734 TaxID=768710 RepID=H5XT78_9FIRM|nr:sigma-54-dependent Fis family transcriptional regulator [Desulfosporosinus youngiae]EHQ88185.1 PAS domain S-box [Desulfosporosinus youngiae DSM 17734]
MGNCTHAVTTSSFPKWDRELLFEILNHIHDVVLVIDSNTTIVYANEAYAKILGVPISKVLGRRLDTIEPGAKTIEVLHTGKTSHDRRSYLDSLGIDVIGSTFPLYNGRKIIGCVSTFKNITDVVELNRELTQTKGVTDYLKEQLEQDKYLPNSFSEYVGQNRRLKETLLLAAKVAKTDSTVLILGESGVGKEVLARAVHNCSRRKHKPMIKVNCAAIPEHLIESELFGYETGAFTGAKKGGKLGKFELAHNGTIFMDEIGDMSLTMQAKLLRVLQEKEFERIGGTKATKVDIRVIAATNRDLEGMIEKGTFRSDLYYRLNIVPLKLTPLRERRDDIIRLAKTFLNQFSKELGRELILSPQVVKHLKAYDWPGNIRELKNIIEHASIVCSSEVIKPNHLPDHILSKKNYSGVQGRSYDVKESVAKVEKELILAALSAYDNNRSKALRALGISRKSFYDKLHRYGIER